METSIAIIRKYRLELKVGETMKKKIQILGILIVFLLSLFMSNSVLATTIARDSRGDGIKKQVSIPTKNINPDDYKPKDLTVSDAGEFIDIANSVIGAIRILQ